MKDLFPNTTRKRKELIKDQLAYIDSVAKDDNQVFEDMLTAGNNGGNACRVFIGGSTEIPVRVLGYVASALRVSQLVPVSQIQVVSVANLASRVNGTDIGAIREQFLRFARISKHVFGNTVPDIANLLTFVEDTDSAMDLIDEITPVARNLFVTNPDIVDRLKTRGDKHGGDATEYATAHFAYQDTKAMNIVRVYGPQPIETERVISIGCLQEKLFFRARKLLRENVVVDNPLPSVQVFSLHVSAPYFEANGGEQLIDDISQTVPINYQNANPATNRELQHLKTFLGVNPHEQ